MMMKPILNLILEKVKPKRYLNQSHHSSGIVVERNSNGLGIEEFEEKEKKCDIRSSFKCYYFLIFFISVDTSRNTSSICISSTIVVFNGGPCSISVPEM